MTGNMLLTLMFDCGLAALLIATIAYCSKLSRRIKMLQDSRGELAGMIAQFDTATNRAMASVNDLQTVSRKITDALQLKIEKANFLADDLAFLIEKSNKLVVQLEQAKLGHKNNEPRQIAKPAPLPALVKSKESLDHILHNLSSHAEAGVSDRLDGAGDVAGGKLVPRTGVERELIAALKLGR